MKFGQFFSENGPLFIWKGGILKINFQKNFGKLEIFILKQYTMGKFIITEEDKKHIKGLYEQSTEFFNSKDTYTPLIGYLVKLSENGGSNKGISDMGAIKELRMYFESLRDGKTPQPLSKPAEIVKNYIMTEIKKLSGEELSSLKEIGRTTNTKM